MPELLNEFIERSILTADKRNLAVENPITLLVDVGNSETFYLVISYLEPNHVTLPLNVTWIVMDEADPDYRKALRRVSAISSGGRRNTWARLTTYQDFLDEMQFWDLSATFQPGEVQVAGVTAASETKRGLFELNRAPADADNPIVIGDNDPAMTNERQPLPHAHPLLPASMVAGSTGINEFYVTITDGQSPNAGEVLMLSGQGDETNEWLGQWRPVVQGDIAYDGATFDSLTINSPVGSTVDEGIPVVFTADAHFSDSSSIASVPVEWTLIAGQSAGNISPSTGVFNSNDNSGDQLVRVQATWTHADSGQMQTATFDLTVVDTTITAVLESITINGVGNVDEGGGTTPFTITATYDDTSTAGVTPTTFTSSNPAAGTLDAVTGIFTTASNVTNDQLTTLTATYTENGQTKSDTLDLTVVDTTVYPQSAEVIGQDSVGEGQSATYVLNVTFTDLTTSQVTVSDWAVDNAAAGSINAVTGVFTAVPALSSAEAAIVSASYTSNGVTVTGNKNISATDDTVYPVSAVVLGATSIEEGASSIYQMEVTFSDTTTAIVAVSDWVSSNTGVGTINATTGELTGAGDLAANGTTDVSASHTASGTTVNASLTVTVTDETNYPVSAAIVGSANMNEGTAQAVLLRVTYQDTSTADITLTADSWTSSNIAVATIDNSGNVTAALNLQSGGATVITGTYTENGTTVSDTLNLNVLDITVYPVSAVILGLGTVSEGTTTSYQLQVTFDDTSVSIMPATDFAIDNATAGAITTTGEFTSASGLLGNEVGNITASYTLDGQTVNGLLAITVSDDTVYPVSANIVGAISKDENTVETYTLQVTFSDASTSVVAVSDWASTNTSVAAINASTGLMTALEQTGNGTTTISASFTSEGTTVSDTHVVTVIDTTVYPVSAEVLGAVSVDEGQTETYTLQVTFSDASVQVMAVTDWASTNAAAAVINATTGLMQATANVIGDGTTSISASYTANGTTVSDSANVTIVDQTVYPVSAVIIGANTVDELASSTYAMSVTFDDTSVVTMPVTDWAIDVPAAGSINATTGEFTAASNATQANIVTNVSASYTLDGATVSASKAIGVVDTTPYPVSAVISGLASVGEGASTNYVFTVTYTDASVVIVSPADWSIDNATAGAIVAGTGAFTASGDVTADQNGTISASYFESGITVSDTLAITVTDDIWVPVSLAINGAASVDEGQSSLYTLTVTYDNAQTATVTATDWALSNAAAGSINATSGLLTTADVTADQVGNITASYTENGATVNDTLAVTVNYLAVPVSAVIIGSATVNESDSDGYLFRVTFDDASVSDVTISDWAASDITAGTINAVTGLFTAAIAVTEDKPCTLSGSFTANGATVNANLAITTINSMNLPVSASVLGVNSLDEGSAATFQFQVTYEDTTTAIVAVSDWAVSNAIAGVINANSGLFNASPDVSGAQVTDITASYTEQGVTVNGSRSLTVNDLSASLVSVAITGLDTVLEGVNTVALTAIATYSDTSTADVTTLGTWTSGNTGAATIGAATGIVTSVLDVAIDAPVTMTFSFTDGITVNDTHVVTVTDYVIPLARWGVAQFADDDLMGGKSGTNMTGGAYETWTGPQDFIDNAVATLMPSNVDSETFTFNAATTADYVYFAHPVALGLGTLIDNATSFPGGWDGVLWADGGYEGTSGPITVQYDAGDGAGPIDWYVYRTDFSGIGNNTFRVDYANN